MNARRSGTKISFLVTPASRLSDGDTFCWCATDTTPYTVMCILRLGRSLGLKWHSQRIPLKPNEYTKNEPVGRIVEEDSSKGLGTKRAMKDLFIAFTSTRGVFGAVLSPSENLKDLQEL
jgi:hypothetical protein